jgi:hypothetical protein
LNGFIIVGQLNNLIQVAIMIKGLYFLHSLYTVGFTGRDATILSLNMFVTLFNQEADTIENAG